jgi:hypothetical protein
LLIERTADPSATLGGCDFFGTSLGINGEVGAKK